MAKNVLRIGFDIDDVLLLSADHTTVLYNEKYGTNINRDHWYALDDLVPYDAATPIEVVQRVNALFGTDGFKNVPALVGAIETVQRLRDEGHLLFAITGRPESVRPETIRTLEALFPGAFPDHNVYFTDYYSHDGATAKKRDIAEKLALTHFVDDQISHVEQMIEADIKAVLFSDSYKWNAGAVDVRVPRITNWQTLSEYFDDEA